MRSRRTRGEAGASLVIALAMIMILAVALVALLGYTTTSVRSVSAVRTQRTESLAADSAVQTYIQTLRRDNYVGADLADPCPSSPYAYTAPANGVNAAVPVTVLCKVVPGDPNKTGRGPQIPNDTAPQFALLAVGTSPSEAGITIGTGGSANKDLIVGGPVGSNSGANPSIRNGSLIAKGYTVDCRAGGYTTNIVAGTITCPGSTRNLGDPGYPSLAGALPDPADLSNFNPAGICNGAGTTTQFKPGYYSDPAVFKVTAPCAAGVLYFRPGSYYFDFGFDGVASQTWNVGNLTVLGGTPKGWDPNAEAPPASSVNTLKTPGFTNAVLCQTEKDDPAANGVQWIMGGSSQIDANNSTMELCAKASAPGSGQQQIVIYGLTSGSGNGATSPTLVPTGVPTYTPMGGTNPAWVPTPSSGTLAVVNGVEATRPPVDYASVTLKKSQTSTLTTGALASAIPSGSLVTGAQLRVDHRETVNPGGAQPDLTTLQIQLARGDTGASCGAISQTRNYTSQFLVDTYNLQASCLTSAAINGAKISVTGTMSNSNTANTTLDVAGVDLLVTYVKPGLRTLDSCSCPFLNVRESIKAFVTWGTIYAPTGLLQAGFKNNTGVEQYRRGVIVRAMDGGGLVPPSDTSLAFCLGYDKCLGPPPRTIVLTAQIAGRDRLRARIELTDFPTLGAGLSVLAWNVVRG